MDEPAVAGGFLKNDREMVVGELSDYNGSRRADIRIMVPSASDEGEWVRTYKGVSIPFAALPDVVQAVRLLPEVAALDKVVGRVSVGREEIRVGLQEFRGNQYAYVRRFYKKGEEWLPSPKGVSVPVARLGDLVELVEALLASAGETG